MDKNKFFRLVTNKGYYVAYDGTFFGPRKHKIKSICDTGYIKTYVYFYKHEGKRKGKKLYAHRLQAYQKYGDKIFEEGIVVRHLDGDKLNNSYENIGIGTQLDNIYDMSKKQRIKRAMGSSRFSEIEMQEIMNLRKNGYTYKQIGELFKVSKSTLSYLFNKAYYSGVKKL